MKAKRRYTHCADCQRCHRMNYGPMVHSYIWRKLGAKPRDILCFGCMLERAINRLGRPLQFSDLRPCLFNLEGNPSYFRVLLPSASKENLKRWESLL